MRQAYVPLRSALSAVGVGVQWANNNGQKVVLTYGGQSVSATVDVANGVLYFQGGTYAYNNLGGSLHVVFGFYQAIFNNANVVYNTANGGIIVSALRCKQTCIFKRVAPLLNKTAKLLNQTIPIMKAAKPPGTVPVHTVTIPPVVKCSICMTTPLHTNTCHLVLKCV